MTRPDSQRNIQYIHQRDRNQCPRLTNTLMKWHLLGSVVCSVAKSNPSLAFKKNPAQPWHCALNTYFFLDSKMLREHFHYLVVVLTQYHFEVDISLCKNTKVWTEVTFNFQKSKLDTSTHSNPTCTDLPK